jgi:glycosyltransferase involved in cell wall biosynthesis
VKVLVVAEQLRRPVPGGIGTYVRGLVGGLRALSEPPTVELIASRPHRTGADAVAALGLRVHTAPLPSRALVVAWDRGFVPVTATADVIHAGSLAVPPAGRAPLTAMIHDLGWRGRPSAYPSRGRRWHEAALRRALRRADVLVVPSEPVAVAVADAGGKGRVRIVQEGCDHLPPPDRDATDALLRDLGVAGPYLLSVSTLEPRKNLARLVDAYRRARPELPEPWPLVVVGPRGWGPDHADLAGQAGVVLAGPVPDRVLAGLYSGARLLAYVPQVEGWGLPVAEAMRAGVPVVATDVPSAGLAARLVDADDTDAIAAGLLDVATDDAVRAGLVDAGRQRAAKLTWVAAAAGHVAIWQELW